MAKLIQVSFTDDEYNELERRARDSGVSITHCIKSRVLENTEFQKWFSELLLRVERIPTGTNFNIKAVLATDWININKGVRLALGRAFYNHVIAGKVTGVKATDKDSANTQWYVKGVN